MVQHVKICPIHSNPIPSLYSLALLTWILLIMKVKRSLKVVSYCLHILLSLKTTPGHPLLVCSAVPGEELDCCRIYYV